MDKKPAEDAAKKNGAAEERRAEKRKPERGAPPEKSAAEKTPAPKKEKKPKEKKPKKERKVRFGKVPRLFKRKYKGKRFAKKILKYLRIPADRQFVERLFVKTEMPSGKKTKVVYAVPRPLQVPAADCKRLKKLAKEIKKQGKSRIKLLNVAVVFAVFIGVLFVIGLFRNYIIRIAMTSAMEGIFGAKCDIEHIDFDIFHTRFTIEGMEVADKNEPMKNLFEVGRFDLYFNLLELTRGKVVSENIELTGINWGTDRETSGELPEKKRKKIEEKKEESGFNFKETVSSVASAVHADDGIAAVISRYDPQKILEAEIAALETPAVIDGMKTEIPALVEKWQGHYDSVMEITQTTADDVKTISSIDPSSLKTAEDVAALITELKEIASRTKTSVEASKSMIESLETDVETVKTLGNSAASAIKNDTAHLSSIADEIADFDLDAGKNLVSDIFETFIRGMLGDYYPYVQRGIAILQSMQNSADKEKVEEERELSLEERASMLSRIPGTTFAFGRSAPQLWLKNIALSCEGGDTGFSGGGRVTNITSDADMLDDPAQVTLAFAKDELKTVADGFIDFRSAAAEIADIGFSVDGTEISIPSGGVTGVPSLDSPAKISGNLGIDAEGATSIAAVIDLASATLTVDEFEPEFLYTLYSGVLSEIKNFSVGMEATVTRSLDLDLSVSSDADDAIASALKNQAAYYVERVKDEVRERAEAYIADLTEQYSAEIEAFDSAVAVIQERFSSLEDIESLADEKIAELEQRVKDLAAEKAEEALAPVKEKIESSIGDALKNIPGAGTSLGGSSSGDAGSDGSDSGSDSESAKKDAANSLKEGLKKLF